MQDDDYRIVSPKPTKKVGLPDIAKTTLSWEPLNATWGYAGPLKGVSPQLIPEGHRRDNYQKGQNESGKSPAAH